jgi:hypothetical protein
LNEAKRRSTKLPGYQGQTSTQTQQSKAGKPIDITIGLPAGGRLPGYQGQRSQASGENDWRKILGLQQGVTYDTNRYRNMAGAMDQQTRTPQAVINARINPALSPTKSNPLNVQYGPWRGNVQPGQKIPQYEGWVNYDVRRDIPEQGPPGISASGVIGPNTLQSKIPAYVPGFALNAPITPRFQWPAMQGPPAPDVLPITVDQATRPTGGGGGGGGGYPSYGGGYGGGGGGGYNQNMPPWFYGLSSWRI